MEGVPSACSKHDMEYINNIFFDSSGIAQAHVGRPWCGEKKAAVEKEKGGGKRLLEPKIVVHWACASLY